MAALTTRWRPKYAKPFPDSWRRWRRSDLCLRSSQHDDTAIATFAVISGTTTVHKFTQRWSGPVIWKKGVWFIHVDFGDFGKRIQKTIPSHLSCLLRSAFAVENLCEESVGACFNFFSRTPAAPHAKRKRRRDSTAFVVRCLLHVCWLFPWTDSWRFSFEQNDGKKGG